MWSEVEWLKINHPKPVCVDHKNYITMQYLLTFLSHVIAINMHKFEGLSDHFVCINDDTFILAPTTRDDYLE